ncbi:transposase [Corynebacterium glucuronolyticum]|uniref:transposase n=1 Tax=Corynebacterium glucuronolyticum TaxID=39791 RepID=UPI0021AED3EB|nr:transposase [Corynebacterium glucuronolyticum]
MSCRVEVFLKEFKRDAVAMYENDPDVSMNQVSKDVGINRATLRYWIDQFGTGKKTTPVAVEKPSDDRNLEDENRRLKKENTRLREERDILVKAAKYFAGETNW